MTGNTQRTLFPDAVEHPWEADDASDRLFVEVAFDLPVEDRFLYEVPYPIRDRVAIGKRVLCPFGRRAEILAGFCTRLLAEAPRAGLKQVQEVIDDVPLLSHDLMQLGSWIADYYCCGLGQALGAMIPGGVKARAGTRQALFVRMAPGVQLQELAEASLSRHQRRVLEVVASLGEPLTPRDLAKAAGCSTGPVESLRRRGLLDTVSRRVLPTQPAQEDFEREAPLALNSDQAAVMQRVSHCLQQGGFRSMLLHGITGSGKTEIYLQAISQVVESGRQAIVLVPEISLTPQTIRRFRRRFERVAVLHSHLTDARRHAEWHQIAGGRAQVVIGARSAVFAPVLRLGLIVIDEEHESTFKQETTPRYHAREVAWQRAAQAGIPLILGSATPSLESWHDAQCGRHELLELPRRVQNKPLPDVKIVDLRSEALGRKRYDAISRPLEQAMKLSLDAGGQVILLLNRRGFSTHLNCFKCGHVEKCPRCDIALVFHRTDHMAVCHFCDLAKPPPTRCPQCRNMVLNYHGIGTEKLEQEVRARFPGYACHRMDTDSMRRPGSHDKVLSGFRAGNIRILLGTQMIAKGLDFPGVTLVGVIAADTALHLPDFRAAERTFQLIAQVSGRAGRGEHPGRVLLQTYSPAHPAIQAASRHDFQAFQRHELPHRQALDYPPFGRMVRIIVRGRRELDARQYCESLADQLRQVAGSTARVLGPAPAPVTKIKNFYRYHLQLQGPAELSLQNVVRQAVRLTRRPARVELQIDVDPTSML